MKRRKMFVSLSVVGVIATMALAGGSASPNARAAEAKGATITIWDFFPAQENAPERGALIKVANQWAKKTGNKIVHPGPISDSIAKFKVAAPSGRGPDIIMFPHDNLGQLVAPGLLAPQPAGFAISRKLYAKTGITAFTYNGKLYGLPIATESYFLFYNPALVKKPASTWAGLITQAKRLTQGDQFGFLWDTTNFYYDYSFIRGFGGYVFKVTKSGYDKNRLGLATAGGIKGLTFIQDLVQKHNLVPATTTTNVMEGKFTNGQAAMIIDGPWAVQGFKNAGVNFKVAPLPRLTKTLPARPFIGMQGFAVNRHSKNVRAAWDLVRYLSIHFPLPLYKASGRVPVLNSVAKLKIVRGNPVTRAVIASSKTGEPMPNIPAMGVVWAPMADVLSLLVQGKVTPREAATTAQERIADAIKKQGG